MADTLATLLSHSGAPGLVHFHHPHHPPSALSLHLPSRCTVVRLDAVEHHTTRLLYAGAIARLAEALGQQHTAKGKGPGEDGREVLTWDAFAHGVRTMWSSHKGKGKTRERDGEEEDQIVFLITKAERLKGVLGSSWTAMTRFPELVGVPATVVFCSQMPWDDLRPQRGDAPEPFHIYLEALSRAEILTLLRPGSTHPLYTHFLDLLLATIGHLAPTSPPSEIDYVASTLWPIYTAMLPPHAEQTLLGKPLPDPENPPPPLSITVKLLTDLKHQTSLALAAASENVLPRTVGRSEFTKAMMPITPDGVPRPVSARTVPQPPPLDLPKAARYLLVAAYCASYNPVSSDLRLFGRGTGADGKRRKGGAVRRAGYGRARMGKVPQRLLGPRPFPIDRVIAMFASLYAEHAERPEDLAPGYDDSEDEDPHGWPTAEEAAARATRRRERELARDEAWEDQVDHLSFSVKLWSLIPELEAQGLLRRSSPVDRLDNIMIRCEIDYETAKTLAKELKITLDEYLYEATV